MSEIAKYDAYKKKLQGICDENNLVFSFKRDTYPITLTIKPIASLNEQMTMLDEVEASDTSPDASLVFYFKDGGITYKTSQTFTIKEALFTKIKNLFKNMHYCWLQYFFRDIIEKNALQAGKMPVIDEDDADDYDTLPEGAEPLDTYDPEDDLPDITDDLSSDEDDDDAEEDSSDEAEIREAILIVRAENKASASLLQRRMNIGYGKASRIIATLEEMGVVGPYNASGPREVLSYDAPEDEEVPGGEA